MPLTGAYGEDKIPDDEIHSLFSSSLDSIRSKLNQSIENLTITSYQTQVVAGLNYRVKATVIVAGESKRIIFTAFKPLPHTQQPLEIKEAHFEE
jgi:hypothetical protein